MIAPSVRAALDAGRPVVALESTLIAHGLPAPDNLGVARDLEALIFQHGATPATIAVLDGVARIGLDAAGLERVAAGADLPKLSTRDLPVAVALGRSGATTVAATAHLAAEAGIAVFATGGLGGVHRGARDTWDVSADLAALASTPVVLVCAGVKSVLDVAATLELLETLGVPLLGFGTDTMPGFYLSSTGLPLDWTVGSAAEVAAVARTRGAVGLGDRAVLVANPVPPSEQLDPDLHHRVLATGLAQLAARGVEGKDVTPFLLEHFHRETGGESLRVNITLVRRNAVLAADIAAALAGA